MSISTVGGESLPQEPQAQGTPAPPLAIDQLPDELLISCLGFLDVKSLTTCSKVSRSWKALSSAEFLWEKLVDRVFPRGRDSIRPLQIEDSRSLFKYLQECKKQNFTEVWSFEHVRLIRQPTLAGKPAIGEITFTVAEGSLYRSVLNTANGENDKINQMLTNINLLGFPEREALAAAIESAPRLYVGAHFSVFDLPQLVINIGVASANVDTQNRFLQLKQAQDEEEQREELEGQQAIENLEQAARQALRRDAYQDGAFAEFYEGDSAILSGSRQIDDYNYNAILSGSGQVDDYNYEMCVRRALSDAQHPNHQKYASILARMSRGIILPAQLDNLSLEKLHLISRVASLNPVLVQRCLEENPIEVD